MKFTESAYLYVKSLDRYANGVSLTYKSKKSFNTFCGGIATILTIIGCVYWWTATALNHLNHHTRNYTQSLKQHPVA